MRQVPQATSDQQRPGKEPGGAHALKNSRHERLAREHAAGASKAEAWRTAFDGEPANAARTFRRPDIQARVEFLRGEFNRLAGISLAALQARLLRIADANVIDYFEQRDGRMRLRDLTALSSAVTMPITELNIDKDGAIKLKTADKLHAIDSLIKTVAPQEAADRGMTFEELVMAATERRNTKVAVQVVASGPSDDEGDKTPTEPASAPSVGRRVRF